MAAQTVFERIEKKYLLTPQQYRALSAELAPHMEPDAYGRYSIGNLYYDTEDYALVRRSLEKPVYKEKLRLRSYGVPGEEDTVFLELKKKYRGVVYKRRVDLPLSAARAYLAGGPLPVCRADQSQILAEIDYFRRFYRPEAKVYLAYDREAYFDPDHPELRITFDRGIRWRTYDLELAAGDEGAGLSIRDKVLMEIKIPGTMPLWLSRALSENGIFPTSISKYGCCYQEFLSQPQYVFIGGMTHAC